MPAELFTEHDELSTALGYPPPAQYSIAAYWNYKLTPIPFQRIGSLRMRMVAGHAPVSDSDRVTFWNGWWAHLNAILPIGMLDPNNAAYEIGGARDFYSAGITSGIPLHAHAAEPTFEATVLSISGFGMSDPPMPQGWTLLQLQVGRSFTMGAGTTYHAAGVHTDIDTLIDYLNASPVVWADRYGNKARVRYPYRLYVHPVKWHRRIPF